MSIFIFEGSVRIINYSPLALKNRKFGLGLNSFLLNLRARHFLEVAHFE